MSAAAQISPRIAAPQLATEMWTSFVSLLRSHVAMHTVARPDGRLRISSDQNSALELLGPYGKLIMLPPTASGTGTIEFRPEASETDDEYSAFFFTSEGLVHFEELMEDLDMEAAVEYLLRKVQA